MWSGSRDAPMSRLGLISVSTIFTSRAQDVIFDQIMQATLRKWAKSVVAIYGSVNPNRLCIIIFLTLGRYIPEGV